MRQREPPAACSAMSSCDRGLSVAQLSSRHLIPLCGLLAVLLLPGANAALDEPGFWDATESELTRLVSDSAPHLRPVKDMGFTARSCDELPGYAGEGAYRLTNATVLVLDEDLLCADFPATCGMGSRAERDAWVLDRAGWFSAVHADAPPDPPNYRYEIPLERRGGKMEVRRACMGGRALMMPTVDGESEGDAGPGWVDVKGVGALRPRMKSMVRGIADKDGLITIFDSLTEFLNEKTVSAVLADHARRRPDADEESFRTVGIYAVLSLGFEFPMELLTEGELRHYAAGAVVRQASRRHPNPYGWMSPPEAAVLEQILNAYGVRSDGPQNDRHFERLPNPRCRRINLQGTMLPRTVTDFGPIQGETEPWPPREDECVVHWGQTATPLDMPLWREAREDRAKESPGEDNAVTDVSRHSIGSWRVREFNQEELRNLGRDTSMPVWPARATMNPRIVRMYEAERCWWEGRCDIGQVEKAVMAGMIDELLLEDEKDRRALLDQKENNSVGEEL